MPKMPALKRIEDKDLALIFDRNVVGKDKEEATLYPPHYITGITKWHLIIDEWKGYAEIQKNFLSFSEAVAWLKEEKFVYRKIWDGI